MPMFQLNHLDKDPSLMDFQHLIDRAISLHEGEDGFPSMEASGITREQLDSYLFDRQAILDSGGSPRTRYTVCGFLVLLPIIILSAIPNKERPGGEWSLFVAIGVGLVLFGLYLLAMRLTAAARRRRLDSEEPACAAYVKAVERWTHCMS